MFPTRAVWELVSQPFKRSQLGLFQGKTKQYGNNVPFSKQKTRRSWLPNIQQKRLPSQVLGENVRLKLTTRALKTIHKKGGLDNYLRETSGELLGHKGMELRIQLQDKVRETKTGRDWAHLKVQQKLFTEALYKTEPRILRDILAPRHATLLGARAVRVMAGKALKKKHAATPEETTAYLASARQYFLSKNLSLV
ncbi:hypothetical protein HYPSUDRAFT_565078 [Hypholoma sublateritium FD-334 SS-4]|uniref:Large ribosomal subunit protein bL28m n=1 Tax=Hypholoma sublateritium (strain FD-334 SS-4) TaxID=945553 RepID=A0A0D2NZ05_HYPSF|nr:hypothetical protein HYPSUDRAFT_565078 [Hypholoma sublateritium FD-334 SS-4]